MADDATKDINYRVGVTDNTAKGIASAQKNVEGMLKQLKTGLGEESGIGQIGKILNGAGAVAGISAVATGLAGVAGKFSELRKQAGGFEDDIAGAAVELGKTLPIYGKVVEAGQAIRNIFTGEQDAIDKMKADAEAAEKSVDMRRKTLADTTDIIQKQADLFAEMRGERSLIGLTGADRDKQNILLQDEAQRKSIDALGKTGKDKVAADYKAELETARQKLKDVQADPVKSSAIDAINDPADALKKRLADQAEREAAAQRSIDAVRRKQKEAEDKVDANTKALLAEQQAKTQDYLAKVQADRQEQQRKASREIEKRATATARANMDPLQRKRLDDADAARYAKEDALADPNLTPEQRARMLGVIGAEQGVNYGQTQGDNAKRVNEYARQLSGDIVTRAQEKGQDFLDLFQGGGFKGLFGGAGKLASAAASFDPTQLLRESQEQTKTLKEIYRQGQRAEKAPLIYFNGR